MSFRVPSDQNTRLQAVDPARSFLVQAPAGSGKTELLTDRILALLAQVQQPEEIVAITFTRAAAAEMHARVIEKLHAASQPEPEQAYKKNSWRLAREAMANNEKQNWSLLEHPARLSIRTIDSLCSHLVRSMPWLSGLGGVPQVSDQADTLYLQAARAVIAGADGSDAVTAVIKHLGVNISAVEQLLVDMLAKRDQWLPTLGQAAALEQLALCLSDLVVESLERLDAALPYGWQDLAACAVYAHTELSEKNNNSLALLADWDESPLIPVADDLARWQALIPFFLTAKQEVRKPSGINARVGFPASGNKALAQQFKNWLEKQGDQPLWLKPLLAIQYLQADYSTEQKELLQQLVQVLWLAVAQLRLAFIDAGQVDFIEIAQRALFALGETDNPSDLLLRVDRRISHLLVDEFQDTSFNQIQLLKRLTAGWQAGDGRTIFLVGDPMQSIYRFRKAEVGLFLEVQEQQRLGDVALQSITLTNNFRSSAVLVDWVNELGSYLLPEQADVELGAVPYTASEAFHDNEQSAGIAIHPFLYKMGEEAVQRQAAEQKVVELCQQALAHYPTSSKPVAVLVRARNHLGDVVRALHQAGVPVKAVDVESLEHRPVVQDIKQLVRALLHPGDRLAWLSLLRSPLCGLTLHSLHLLCGHDRLATIPDLIEAAQEQDWDNDEWQRLQHVANVLLDVSYRSGGLPFAAWVEHCWMRLGGESIYASINDKADAENVFRLLEKLAPYGQLDLDAFEAEVRQMYAAAKNAEGAVEVMTFHKSKGLEFESVILYDLNRRSMSQREPLLQLEQTQGRLYVGMIKASEAESRDALSQFIAQREKQRAEYELQRLLYVGVTRARHQLHLVGIALYKENAELKPTAGSLLDLLWPMVQTSFSQSEPLTLSHEKDTPPLPAYRFLHRAQNITDLPWVGPRHIPAGINHWEWKDEPFKEAAIGTVAHAWLERLGRDGRNQWPIDKINQCGPVIERQLLRAGLAKNEVGQATYEVQQTLIATLSSEKGQWLLDVAKAYREWTLLDAQGRVSIIDLAISHENEWLIVDFKTAQPHPGQSLANFTELMRTKYAKQLRRYCEQVTAFDGRAARAALYFPRADLWCEI